MIGEEVDPKKRRLDDLETMGIRKTMGRDEWRQVLKEKAKGSPGDFSAEQEEGYKVSTSVLLYFFNTCFFWSNNATEFPLLPFFYLLDTTRDVLPIFS